MIKIDTSKIALISPGILPVPAIKGGAIETLIDILVEQNEKYNQIDLVIYSIYDKQAYNKSKDYKYTSFVFIKRNLLISIFESIASRIARIILKKNFTSTFIRRVIRDVKKRGIKDIVVEGNIFFVSPLKNKIENADIYLHIHHDVFNSNIENQEIILKSSKMIISVSEYIKYRTLIVDRAFEHKIKVLKNCIDVDKFSIKNSEVTSENLRGIYNIKQDEVVIVFTGRILPIKGVKELIQAFKKIPNTLKVKLLIVGNAGFGQSTKSKYDEELVCLSKEIQEKIVFTGFIHNNNLPKILAMSDIAVVPSIWEEPAGLVVIEAMAAGLPLIVTDSGGMSEYTCDKCAMVVDRDGKLVEKLTEAMIKLATDEKLRIAMGKAGKEQAQQFNSLNYYKNFINLILDKNEIR